MSLFKFINVSNYEILYIIKHNYLCEKYNIFLVNKKEIKPHGFLIIKNNKLCKLLFFENNNYIDTILRLIKKNYKEKIIKINDPKPIDVEYICSYGFISQKSLSKIEKRILQKDIKKIIHFQADIESLISKKYLINY
jgi:hypothetical protein